MARQQGGIGLGSDGQVDGVDAYRPTRRAVHYLVRKGTRIIVQKPSGEVTQHTCKADTLFHAFEKVSEFRMIQFKRDGFVVSVAAADVVEVSFRCPQCGGKSEIEGLCEGCRRGIDRIARRSKGRSAPPAQGAASTREAAQ